MIDYVLRVSMPEGFRGLPREDVESLLENAIRLLNTNIKVTFGHWPENPYTEDVKKVLTKANLSV